MRCIFCFNETGKIYFDRKGRPYYFDPLCGNRIFFRSPIALKAIMAWSETAKSISQEEFLTMIRNMENTQIYRDNDVQKWVNEVEKPEEIIRSKKDE